MVCRKVQGHYCKICAIRKSNESFRGKGRATHICKTCACLSPEKQAEQMTLRRLENLPPHRLSESEMTWLKNRAHDHRPEVKSLACAVFAERFPCTARKPGFLDMLKTTLWRSRRAVFSSPYSFPETPPRSAPACTPSHPPSCRPATGTAPRPARLLRTGWAPPPPPGSRCPPR